MMKIGKKELVAHAVQKLNMSAADAGATFDTIVENISLNLSAGVEVSLPGIGILKPATRSARTGRDPRTGAAVDVPAQHTVRFRPSTTLKSALN